jgi:hypothetical protein
MLELLRKSKASIPSHSDTSTTTAIPKSTFVDLSGIIDYVQIH